MTLDIEKANLRAVSITDSNYLSRCSTMIESANIESKVSVLGLDEGVQAIKLHFGESSVSSWGEFLDQNVLLARAVVGRSKAEQIFTAGPSFLLEQTDSVAEQGWLVYCDADLLFFQGLENYLSSFDEANVVVAAHRHYLWNSRRLAKYGEYNVGLVAFKNNEEGLRALRFWADSCLEWCFDRPEDGKYADQKYLERFSSVSSGVHVDNSLGANLAPWNSFLKRISSSESGDIFVQRDKLIYFHAQGLKQKKGRWILGHLNYLSFAGPRLKKLVYRPYLEKLEEWAEKPGFEGFGTSRAPTTLLGRFVASVTYALSLLTGQTIKVLNRRSGAP